LSAKGETRSTVEGLWWWHTIDLPGGVRTSGHQRIEEQEFIARNIPQDLSAKTVLDIGAADGYFSFLAEKRKAAKILAIDVFQGYEPEERRIGIGQDGKRFLKTFALAKNALLSNVSYENCDLFELDRFLKFDLIFFFGVYYHLKDPAKAIHAVVEKLNPGGLLLLEGLVRAGNQKPILHKFRESEIEPTTFCSANITWLTETLHSAGLERVGGVSIMGYKNPLLNLIINLGWSLGLNFGPYKRAYRAFIAFKKPT
jgi:tRNA (mo5U34)-methyltransferase